MVRSSENLYIGRVHDIPMGKDIPTTIVAVTGATGAAYAKRLMELLPGNTYLIITGHGKDVVKLELEGGVGSMEALATKVLKNDDLGADISSGSGPSRRMVIVPCSMNTLSKIACGLADNLVTRAASVCLKEDWPLVIVPRETPLSLIHLENMTRLKRAGAVILPAAPGFYNAPRRIEDLVDFVAGKVLIALGFEKEGAKVLRPWKGQTKKKT